MSEPRKYHLWYHETTGNVTFCKKPRTDRYKLLSHDSLQVDAKAPDIFPPSAKIVQALAQEYGHLKKNRRKKRTKPGSEVRRRLVELWGTTQEIGDALSELAPPLLTRLGGDWNMSAVLGSSERSAPSENKGSPSPQDGHKDIPHSFSAVTANTGTAESGLPDNPATCISVQTNSDRTPSSNFETNKKTLLSDRDTVHWIQAYRVCKLDQNLLKPCGDLLELKKKAEQELQRPPSLEGRHEEEYLAWRELREKELKEALTAYERQLWRCPSTTQEVAFAASLTELESLLRHETDIDFEHSLRQLAVQHGLSVDWNSQAAEQTSPPLAADPSDSAKFLRVSSASASPAVSPTEVLEDVDLAQPPLSGMGRRRFSFDAFMGGGGKGLDWPLLEDRIAAPEFAITEGFGTHDDRVRTFLRGWCTSALSHQSKAKNVQDTAGVRRRELYVGLIPKTGAAAHGRRKPQCCPVLYNQHRIT